MKVSIRRMWRAIRSQLRLHTTLALCLWLLLISMPLRSAGPDQNLPVSAAGQGMADGPLPSPTPERGAETLTPAIPEAAATNQGTPAAGARAEARAHDSGSPHFDVAISDTAGVVLTQNSPDSQVQSAADGVTRSASPLVRAAALPLPMPGVQRVEGRRSGVVGVRPPADLTALVKAFPNEYLASGQARAAAGQGAAPLEVHPRVLLFTRIPSGWHPGSQALELRSPSGRPVRFSVEASAGIALSSRRGTVAPGGTSISVALEASAVEAEGAEILVRNLDVAGDLHRIQVRVVAGRTGADPAVPQPLRSVDAAGRLERLVQPDGVILDYRYDPAGHLLAVSSTDGYHVSFTYDSEGRRASMTDAQGVTVYRYDAAGRLAQLYPPGSPAPAPVSYRYDQAGYLSQLLYPDGRSVDYGWDGQGRLVAAGGTGYEYEPASGWPVRESLANGMTAEFDHDAQGGITDVIYRDAEGASRLALHWDLDFDGLPLLVRRTTGDGEEVTSYRWDTARRLAGTHYPDGSAVEIAYDDSGRRARVTTTDAAGVTSIDYGYDAAGRLVRAGDETLAYDGRGNLVRRSSPRQTVEYAYDAENQLVRVHAGERQLELHYDGDGRQVARIEDGRPTQYLLDASGNLLLETTADDPPLAYLYGLERFGAERGTGDVAQRSFYLYDRPFWNLAAVADAAGGLTASFPEAVLAELARSSSRAESPLALGGAARDPMTGLVTLDGRAYDPVLGIFINQPSPELAVLAADIGANGGAGWPVDLTARLSGRPGAVPGGMGPRAESSPSAGVESGGGSGAAEAGHAAPLPGVPPVQAHVSTLASNELPESTRRPHPASPRPFPALTQLGRRGPTAPGPSTAASGATVTPHLHIHPEYLNFARTAAGLVPASQTLEIGSTNTSAATFSVTGSAPWLSLSATSGTGGTPPSALTVTVDTSKLASSGSPYTAKLVVSNSADSTDVRTVAVRVTVSDALAAATLRSYDASGRPERIVRPNGEITDFDYDPAGRLIGVRYPGGLSIGYTYDGNGNRATMTDARGTTIYQYDPQNRLAAVYNPGINPVQYAYDTGGHVTSISYPDGSTVTYSYDADGRMIAAQSAAGTTTYTYDPTTRCVAKRTLPNGAVTTYTCDVDGRLTDVVHKDAATNLIESFHYTLDAQGRRTAVAHATPAGTTTTSYGYDALGRLVAVTYPGAHTAGYAYDAAGNRTSWTDSAAGSTAYQYDAANELIRAGGEVFQYDGNGRLVRRASPQRTLTYLYNGQNLLSTVSDGTNVTTFEYDGDGIRVAKVVNGQRTNYVNTSGPLAMVLMEADSSWNPQRSYSYGVERLAVAGANGAPADFFLDDGGGGSVVRVIDGSAATVASYQYGAFGAVTQESGALANSYTFDSEQNDPETGLIYLRGRYYDPTTGRYLTPDPAADLHTASLGQSPYVFVQDDPVNQVDPLGLVAVGRYIWSELGVGADNVKLFGELVVIGGAGLVTLPADGVGGFVAGFLLGADFGATVWDREIKRAQAKAAWDDEPEPHFSGDSGLGLLINDAFAPFSSPQTAESAGKDATTLSNVKDFVESLYIALTPSEWMSAATSPSTFSTFSGAIDFLRSVFAAPSGSNGSSNQSQPQPIYLDSPPDPSAAPTDFASSYLTGAGGDLGGVFLNATANLLLQLQDVTGATYDQNTGQLVILGKQDVTLPQMNLDDLAVAVRTEYGGTDPGVSIEPPITNGQMNVRYVGQTPQTNFGELMFEADRTLKILGLGKDNVTGQPVTSQVPGYQNMLQRRLAAGCNGLPTTTRMWFQPQQVNLVLSSDGQSMVFSNVTMELLYESKVGDQVVADPVAAAFAAHFTQHYEDFAAERPILKQLERLAKVVAVIKWIKDNNLPIDLSFINEHQIAFFSTPVSTPATTVIGASGSSCIISLQGGVSYEPPNQYQPDNPSSPVTDPLRQAALASRPSEGTFSWTFQAPAGPSAGSTTAVSQSFARFRRTGNTHWQEIDLRYPQPGPFPLELARWYDSFSDQVGPFGPGWHVLPFELRFPVEQETFTFGAANTAYLLFGSIWLADRLAGREDEYMLLGIDSNNLPLYQRSGAVDLLRQRTDGTFLLVKVTGSQITFNAAGAVTAIIDPNGNTLGYNYDASQRLVSISGTGGRAISLTYNSQGEVSQAAGPDGRQLQYAYDSTGNLASVTDPASQTHTFGYDSSGHVTAAQDALGKPVFAGSYDAYGRTPSRTLNTGASYSSSFDLTHQTATTTDPAGGTWSGQFDDRYRPLQVSDPLGNQQSTTYDGDFGPQGVTDEKGGLTTLSYDMNGNLTTVVDANGNQVQHFYDYLNRLVATRDPAGTATGFGYDASNNLTTVYHNVQLIQDSSGNLTSFNYDPSNVTSWAFDAAGNVSSATDPQGHQVKSIYNANGQPVQTTLPSGLVASRSYDARSRLSSVLAGSRQIAIGYDTADRVTSLTTGSGAQTHFAWDADGHLVQATDATANSTSYTYDADGNMASVKDAAGNVASFAYDVQHHLLGVTPAAGAGRSFQYDELGRPVVALAALGTATPVLGLAQSTLDFGRVAVGTTPSLTLSIYSLGQAPLVVSAITCPAPWSVAFNGPATVLPGQTLAVTVTFAPQDGGAASGSLTVTSNDPGQPQQVVALTGVGVLKVVNLRATSTTAGIELDWDPFNPGSQAFAHFNVYRSASPIPGDVTGLAPLDQSLTSVTAVSFVDTTAVAGAPYYYAVTPQYTSGFEEKSVDPVGPVIYYSAATAFGPIGTAVAGASDTHALLTPALAYNSSAGEYLAVYARDTNGDGSNLDVLGQRLSASGAPLGAVIPIATSAASEQAPAVAFSPVTKQYLIVFEVAASPTNWDIYGRMVSATGATVGNAFPIATNPTNDRRPRLAYDATDDKFLMVFDSVVSGGTRRLIKGRQISSSGALLGAELTLADFSVSSKAVDTRNPQVVYDTTAHEYLMGCEIDTLGNGTEIDIAGVRMTPTGALGNPFILLELNVNGTAVSSTNPSLAFDSTHDEYMIAVQVDVNGNGSSFDVIAWKFLFDATGAPAGVAGNTLLDLSTAAHEEMHPRVGYSAITDEDVVVWESGTGASVIEAARVQVTPSLLSVFAGFEVAGGADAEHVPDLAWNSATNDYLVGWQRSPSSGPSDIRLRRIGYSPPLLTLSSMALAFGDTQTQLPVSLSNLGPGTLEWSTVPSAPWLGVQPASGSTTDTSSLTVTVSRTGLAPGSYSGGVQFSSNGGTATLAVTMTVDSTAPDAPSQPTPASGAVAQGGATAGGVSLTLSWQGHDASGYALTFDVYLSTDGTRVGALDPTVRIEQGGAASTLPVSGLAFATTYSWRVVAADGHGGVTGGPVWSFTTVSLAAPQLIPVTPSPTRNPRPVLAWQPVTGAATYLIQVATDASFGAPLVSLAGLTATSFTPSTALPQGVLYWRVQADDGGGRPGPFSAASSFEILTTPPPVPQLIAVSPNPTNNATPTLAWGPVSGATSYRLQVGQSSNLSAPLLDITTTATSYVPGSSLPEGNIYWQAASIDAAGNQSAFSTPSSFALVLTPPPPIGGLAAQRTTAGVVLTWSALAPVPQYFGHFNVYRATSSFSNVAGMTAFDSTLHNPLAATYTDAGATVGVAYYYAVTAVDTLGNENKAVVAVAAPPYVLPGSPQNPVPANGASGLVSPVALGWQAASLDGGPLTYDVYLSTQAAAVSALDLSTRVATGLASPSASASGLDYLTTYWWRVVAFNAHGGSTAGPPWSFTTAPIPAPVPIAYSPSPTNNSRPTLTWMPVPLASAYGIEIDLAGTFVSPAVAVDGIGGTSFTPAAPLPEGILYWRVRAFDSHARAGVYSGASTFQLILTPPPPVTGLTAAWITGKIHLGWTPSPPSVTVFDHYNVYRAAAHFTSIAGMTPLATGLSGTSYVDGTAAVGSTYYYAVTAVDKAGNEDPAVTSVAPVAAASFYTVAPCRLVDTRNPNGPFGGPALAGGSSRSFALAGRCGIPATAKAVSLNVTVIAPSVGGDLRIFPGGITLPATSTINFVAGSTRANNAVIGVAADGQATLSVFSDIGSGTVEFILDVNGYFQ